jgi:DNA-binding NarL/FixJ family response regulator
MSIQLAQPKIKLLYFWNKRRKKMPKPTDEQILEKLDQILRVLSIQVGSEKSLTERARMLKLAGLENQAIADVLNTSVQTIRTLTSNLRIKPRRRR